VELLERAFERAQFQFDSQPDVGRFGKPLVRSPDGKLTKSRERFDSNRSTTAEVDDWLEMCLEGSVRDGVSNDFCSLLQQQFRGFFGAPS